MINAERDGNFLLSRKCSCGGKKYEWKCCHSACAEQGSHREGSALPLVSVMLQQGGNYAAGSAAEV